VSDELWKGRSFPRAALIGGAIIFGGSIIYAVLAKNYGIGRSEAEFAPAAVEREILFREIDLNNMEVFADGEKLGDFNVNDEGFIFGIVRGLGHYRTVNLGRVRNIPIFSRCVLTGVWCSKMSLPAKCTT